MTKKKTKKQKPLPLQGFTPSGTLFIGDPIYMGADLSQPGAEEDAAADVTNPFKNFPHFVDQLAGIDQNLMLPDSYRDVPVGRGCVVQLQRMGGGFKVKKKIDKATGRLKSITIILEE